MDKQARKIKELLISEKGIGEQTAAILIASLPELGKLENRQIAKNWLDWLRWLMIAEK